MNKNPATKLKQTSEEILVKAMVDFLRATPLYAHWSAEVTEDYIRFHAAHETMVWGANWQVLRNGAPVMRVILGMGFVWPVSRDWVQQGYPPFSFDPPDWAGSDSVYFMGWVAPRSSGSQGVERSPKLLGWMAKRLWERLPQGHGKDWIAHRGDRLVSLKRAGERILKWQM